MSLGWGRVAIVYFDGMMNWIDQDSPPAGFWTTGEVMAMDSLPPARAWTTGAVMAMDCEPPDGSRPCTTGEVMATEAFAVLSPKM